MKYSVGRWVKQDFLSAPQRVTLDGGNAIAPRYRGKDALKHAQKEVKHLSGLFSVNAITPATLDGIEEHLSCGEAMSFLHFACHGEAGTEGDAGMGIVLEQDEFLDDVTLRGMSAFKKAFGKASPFVFMNACEVARQKPALTGVGGLAPTFLIIGAAAVLAPLWTVKDDIAFAVAKEFYTAAKAQPDKPFAEILRDIRARAYRSPYEDSWAAYVFYGDPLRRRRDCTMTARLRALQVRFETAWQRFKQTDDPQEYLKLRSEFLQLAGDAQDEEEVHFAAASAAAECLYFVRQDNQDDAVRRAVLVEILKLHMVAAKAARPAYVQFFPRFLSVLRSVLADAFTEPWSGLEAALAGVLLKAIASEIEPKLPVGVRPGRDLPQQLNYVETFADLGFRYGSTDAALRRLQTAVEAEPRRLSVARGPPVVRTDRQQPAGRRGSGGHAQRAGIALSRSRRRSCSRRACSSISSADSKSRCRPIHACGNWSARRCASSLRQATTRIQPSGD